MAYIPPHRRHSSRKAERTTLFPLFPRYLNRRPYKSEGREENTDFPSANIIFALPGGNIIYARDSSSSWWVGDFTDADHFPFSILLEPISFECKYGDNRKPLALVSDHPPKELIETSKGIVESPWMSIAEKIQAELLTSFQDVRNEMDFQGSQVVKPSFLACLGTLFFRGQGGSYIGPRGCNCPPSFNMPHWLKKGERSPSIVLGTSSKSSDVKDASSQLCRTFYTNISSTYMEAILGDVIPKIGVEFDVEKEYYHIKVADNTQPYATIWCKCIVMNDDEKLEIHKIEMKKRHHLLVDILCLNKNLDLRLMLSTKRILTELMTDDEKDAFRILVKSAVIDPDVKGGLRWPLGKDYFGDRYSVVGVWHIKTKAFKSSSMRLKLRHADRINFRFSSGAASTEVNLKMTGINGHLRGQMVEPGSLMEMLQDTLKMIWDHFLM